MNFELITILIKEKVKFLLKHKLLNRIHASSVPNVRDLSYKLS